MGGCSTPCTVLRWREEVGSAAPHPSVCRVCCLLQPFEESGRRLVHGARRHTVSAAASNRARQQALMHHAVCCLMLLAACLGHQLPLTSRNLDARMQVQVRPVDRCLVLLVLTFRGFSRPRLCLGLLDVLGKASHHSEAYVARDCCSRLGVVCKF